MASRQPVFITSYTLINDNFYFHPVAKYYMIKNEVAFQLVYNLRQLTSLVDLLTFHRHPQVRKVCSLIGHFLHAIAYFPLRVLHSQHIVEVRLKYSKYIMTRAKLVNGKSRITFNSHFLNVEVIHHIIFHMPAKSYSKYLHTCMKHIKNQNKHTIKTSSCQSKIHPSLLLRNSEHIS